MIAIIILFLFMLPAYKYDYNIIVYDQTKPELFNHANDFPNLLWSGKKKFHLLQIHNSWSVDKYLMSNDTIHLACSVFTVKTSLHS